MSDLHDIVIPDPNCLSAASQEAKAETVGLGKATNSLSRVLVLALMAGRQSGMGALFMTVVKSDSALSFGATQLLCGLSFGLGLICVIVAGSELFTGNSLMVIGAMSKKFSWGSLAKNWVIVWLGNLVGSLVLVAIIYACGTWNMNGGAVGDTMVAVATSKINLSWGTIFFRGIMCNILVCLAVWMGFAGKSVIDKIFTSVFPVTAFVACGFEHCVANMFFLPMGLIAYNNGFGASVAAAADVLNFSGIVYNISAATLGNIVGGAVFVGLVYWFAYRKKAEK